MHFLSYSTQMQVRILADDLSGAADCAAAFAQATGGELPVHLDRAPAGAASYALDTDSRARDPDTAARIAAQALADACAGGGAVLPFKKIDSTLRGHLGAELHAALEAVPGWGGALVAPAFPEQGRTLQHGRLHLDGRPHPAGAAADAVQMLAAWGLRPACLDAPGGDAAALAQAIASSLRAGARCVVVDGRTPADLAAVAAVLQRPLPQPLLAVGSAGLARAIAQRLPAEAAAPRPADGAGRGPAIAVVGSFSPVSQAQVRRLAALRAVQVVRCEAAAWLDGAAARRPSLAAAQTALAAGRPLVFSIAGAPAGQASRDLVRTIAAAIAPLLRQAGALVLTGGDTARAVLDSLGLRRLEVAEEREPGVSCGRSDALPGTRIFIKAGAFGDEDTLLRLFDSVGRLPQPQGAPALTA